MTAEPTPGPLVSRAPYGPGCLFFCFESPQDRDLGGFRRALVALLENEPPQRLVEYSLGVRSVLLEFGELPQEEIEALSGPMLLRLRSLQPDAGTDAKLVEVPVLYGGPDLARVAARSGLSEDEVVSVHSSSEYEVAVIGFSPGFAYLEGLDPRLHAPRLAVPRPKIPAGSVAIGGAYTGVYPQATPGGWNLIGRTEEVFFDVSRRPASLLKPGDKVRFKALR